MPIDPSVAIGAELPDRSTSPGPRATCCSTTSRSARPTCPTRSRVPRLQVLPSFGIVAPTFHETDPPPLDLPGCDINLAQVVHGSQSIEVDRPAARPPAPPRSRTRITDVWDKGKAAVIWQEGVATAPSGEELWTVRSSIFVRGEGGWGGDRGSSVAVELPDRAPDADTTYDVAPTAGAALPALRRPQPAARRPRLRQGRRLPGADPARPVLLRASCCAPSPTSCSAATPPGSAASPAASPASCSRARRIRVRGWQEDGRIVAAATIAGEGERDGAPVLLDCVLTEA